MRSGNWKQVEEIFEEALQREGAEREAYVQEATSDLRREHRMSIGEQ